jgi:serine/threonine protein kinase
VTSYVDGHDLASILRGRQTLSGEELERLIWPLLDALAMIHDEDVLHRGIKPDNILIGPQGRPLLHDFGAARQALSQQTNSLKSFVTSGYSPIEQYSARGNQGPWTDIYGLGATLYRAVTGSKPPDAVHRAHADTYAPAAEVAGRKHPRNILLGIDKALAWKAADRPQSIAELRAIFETGQSG